MRRNDTIIEPRNQIDIATHDDEASVGKGILAIKPRSLPQRSCLGTKGQKAQMIWFKTCKQTYTAQQFDVGFKAQNEFLWHQFVATGFGDEQGRIGRVFFNFLTQPVNVGFQCVGRNP